MVVVERLAVVILGKQRAFERFFERVGANIGVGIVNEHARLNVARGIDVEIVSAAGNTAADIFGVVLEVHDENRFAGFRVADFPKPVIHKFTLLGGGDQFFVRVVPDRHVVKAKRIFRAFFNNHVDKRVAGDIFEIFARVANRNAEQALVFVEQIHCVNRAAVSAFAAPPVVGFLGAL